MSEIYPPKNYHFPHDGPIDPQDLPLGSYVVDYTLTPEYNSRHVLVVTLKGRTGSRTEIPGYILGNGESQREIDDRHPVKVEPITDPDHRIDLEKMLIRDGARGEIHFWTDLT